MSVYSSTDQINLLKNIFTPQFQVGQGGYFHPSVHTYLPGDVEIGDPTTNYALRLNGNALATDITVAEWSRNPAISTLSMGSNSITGVTDLSFYSGGNFMNGLIGNIRQLKGVESINGFNLCLGSALTIGTEVIRLGQMTQTANTSVSDQVCIGSNAGTASVGESLVAIGWGAGNGGPGGVSANASGFVVSIGRAAGQSNLAGYGVFIGYYAGQRNSGQNVVSLGNIAGCNNLGSNVVAIGYQAALSNARSDIVAVGTKAAANNSGQYVVAAGYQAGHSNTGSSVVALGFNAGFQNSGNNCLILGSNSTDVINTPNTSNNTFYVYSTQANKPFLQGDMSANTLGVGVAPASGFALTVQGSVQNRLNISTATGTLNLTSANATTRFFVSNTVTLSFASGSTAGTHWIVTNTSSVAVVANICGGTVYGSTSISLAGLLNGVGRSTTFAYSGTTNQFYAF
jgi:hypothetical protein